MEYPITRENESVLTVHYQPDYSAGCLSILLAVAITAIVFLTIVRSSPQDLWILLACASPHALLGGWFLISSREVYCAIDKSSKKIQYTRGGILGSSVGAKKTEYDFSDIAELEMKKIYGRPTGYQIRLILVRGGKLNLLFRRFNYDECHSIAQQIREFVGDDLPMDREDRSFKFKSL